MSNIYEYTDAMDEISGFGGGYEATCRAMVLAGVKFLDEKSESDPKFSTYENIYGLIKEDNDDAKAMTKAMFKAANNDCTGAMMHACVSHVLAIKQLGWAEYARIMTERKETESEK